jgi:protocatechuate 3,4-dioxygenase beta subunit
MRVIGAFAFASVVALSTAAYGQAATPGQPVTQPSPTPQRAPARPLRPGEAPPKGTGVLKGQVVAAGTGTPVRRAQVRAISMEGRGGGVTSTDNEGRFEIKELAAGRYSISASKGGFAAGQYGQRRPGDPGTPIELAEGQIAEKVNFVLTRGGVIAGRIVDDGGEPVSGTQVSAMRFAFVAGARRLVPGNGEGGTDRTDDQGSFRLYGLAPGDYFISANNRSGQMMMGPNINNTEADGFAPTYYPGTPSLGEASRITLKPGQEMSGANFALIVARMARIKGRALNSRGEAFTGGMLMLMPADPLMGMNFGMNMSNAMVAADGTFQFANIAPGRYNLQVRPNGMPGANSEFAMVPVTVGNEDIDNLIVSTSTGATARGVIVTDDGSPAPFRHDQVQIFSQPLDPNTPLIGGPPAKVNEDYSFEITGLSDRRTVRAIFNPGTTPTWFVKAVLFDGEDVTDHGIDFAPGRAYEGLQIVVTQKVTDLSGLVTDDRNRPVVDATVILFPANRDLWIAGSRYLRTARPDTNGRYSFKSMPPSGEYMVIAVQNLESGQGGDPDFLTRAIDEAKRLSLNEGETKTVDIKLSQLVP